MLWLARALVAVAGICLLLAVSTPQRSPDAVMFLGDSLTARMDVLAVIPDAVNLGVGGRTSAQLLAAMGQLPLREAGLVVLTIGTNDAKQGLSDGFETRMRRISNRIEAPLVLSLIPPNRDADVRHFNAAIERVCAERPDCVLVRPAFTPDDLLPDGTHLNQQGYDKWLKVLRAALPPVTA